MIEWWNTLSLTVQTFYCIAIPATLVLLVQTVLMLIGFGEDADGIGDMDGDAEFDAGDLDDISDLDGLGDLRVFTVRGIIAFFVVFGWVGVAMLSAGVNLYITILSAAACGLLMMVAIAYLFRAVMKLRSDGNTDNRNALGTAGKVHLTIPASRSGEGKVHIMLQGSYVERNAVTDSEEPIPTGSEVVVVGVSGQTDLVVKKK